MDIDDIAREAGDLIRYLKKRDLDNFQGALVTQAALFMMQTWHVNMAIKQMQRDGTDDELN